MATILPHSLPPLPPLLSQRRSSFNPLINILPMKYPSQKIVASCSSSSLRQPLKCSSPPFEVTVSPELDSVDGIEEIPDFRGCKTCGREEIEKGCNGEGGIQGGIATVPGFGWWPIKAFRPCPRFVASGGRYRRRGQSMDEVAFGRTERDTPVKLKAKSRHHHPFPREYFALVVVTTDNCCNALLLLGCRCLLYGCIFNEISQLFFSHWVKVGCAERRIKVQESSRNNGSQANLRYSATRKRLKEIIACQCKIQSLPSSSS